MKARNLKALQIDLEGKLTLEGKPIRAIPIGRPDIVSTEKRTRTEGRLRYGEYGVFERTVKIPENADSFVLGTRACENYAPIQFYRIEKFRYQKISRDESK